MCRRVRIAIDGPVASGKSTVGRHLARVLAYLYLDTGAMYRGITALALRHGTAAGDEDAVSALAWSTHFDFPELTAAEAVNPPLHANGEDITALLRLPEVERAVSVVSSYGAVRAAMVEQQRRIAASRSVVMVGRDIGTVVLPDAEVKIFLTASVAERALRRYEERRDAGGADYAETLRDIQARDEVDSTRALSPLKPAEDAVVVDSSGLTMAEAAERVLAVVRARVGTPAQTTGQ